MALEDSWFSGVSCPSAGACTAVGDDETIGGSPPRFAERWNGSDLGDPNPPRPGRRPYSALSGVSCVSTGECMAVGGFGTSTGGAAALAERWDGTAWELVAVPIPSGGTDDTWLNGRVLHFGESVHGGRH